MNTSHYRLTKTFAACLAAISIALAGCSTDSPTAPVQQPGPASGTQVSAAWKITVKSSPRQVTVGATNPATVSVTVRRVDDNQPPPQGTTIVLSTSLGEFNAAGSGLSSIALATANGRADAFLFPGAILGTALITAQLEASAGQVGLPIVEAITPVEAAFDFANSNENLSVQFRDSSLGNPDKFRWDFGDGATSKQQNPSHLYALEGDYVVTLTASKKNSEDTISQIVSVTEDPDDIVEASFDFIISDRTVVFQDTSTGDPTSFFWDFGDGSSSSEQNPTHVFAEGGSYVVSLRAANRRSSDTTSQIVTVSEDEFFIIDVTPNQGPPTGGTTVTITGQGFVEPLRVSFGGVLATTVSVSGDQTQIVVITPPFDIDPSNEGIECLAVPVKVELSTGEVGEVTGGFTYVSGTGDCA